MLYFVCYYNSIYSIHFICVNYYLGKSTESMRNRMKMELASSERRLKRLINKPAFKNCTDLRKENLTAVMLENKMINFCKPIFIGQYLINIY